MSGTRGIRVRVAAQTLTLSENGRVLACYPVSTGRNGTGELNGSGCTPRGLHRVRLRIGAGCPIGTVFRARRPTGEVWDPDLAAACPGRDWILTRVLWLTGCEPGRNRGGCVDTLRRFIYIHGTPDTEPMGEPRSHGCIRMRNADLVELFDLCPVGTPVEILDCPPADPALASGAAEPPQFYGFRPLAAGNRGVSADTVERLRNEEAV